MNKNNIKILALFLSIGLLFLLLLRFIGFDGLYGQDAYAYAKQTEQLFLFVSQGSDLPSFHWPSGYPIMSLPLQFILQDVTWSMQLTSMVFWSLTLFVSYQLLLLITPQLNRQIALLASVFFLGSAPYFFRLGFSAMSDVSCAFFCVSCFYFVMQFTLTRKAHFFYLASLFFVGAVFTRYVAFIVLLSPMVFGVILLIKNRQFKTLIPVITIAIGGVLSLFLIKDFGEFISLLQRTFTEWSLANFFSNSYSQNGLYLEYPTINLLYILRIFYHPGFFLISVPALLLSLKSSTHPPITFIISLVIYLLFIGGLETQNNRFFVAIMPLIFVVFFFYLSRWNYKHWQQHTKKYIVIIGVLNIALTIYSSKVIYSAQQQDRILASKVAEHNPSAVFTFEVDLALAQRGVNCPIHNFWYLDTLEITFGDLVLINPSKWKEKWSEHQLMDHVNWLMSSGKMTKLESLTSGWELYEYE